MQVLDYDGMTYEDRTKPLNLNSLMCLSLLVRLLEFMQVICTMISDEENDHNMREIATAAYYQALAPHHPWLVRTAAGVALFAVPNKDRFLALLETDQASAIRDLRTFKVMSKPVLDSLFDFHEENGLNKL